MKSDEQKTMEDWRNEISDEPGNYLKIADGESVEFVFMSEGMKKTHPDYGTSVIFEISVNEELMAWYVNANNFDLLKQIKELGKLTGQKVRVSRKGSKKSDTRYTIEPVDEETSE